MLWGTRGPEGRLKRTISLSTGLGGPPTYNGLFRLRMLCTALCLRLLYPTINCDARALPGRVRVCICTKFAYCQNDWYRRASVGTARRLSVKLHTALAGRTSAVTRRRICNCAIQHRRVRTTERKNTQICTVQKGVHLSPPLHRLSVGAVLLRTRAAVFPLVVPPLRSKSVTRLPGTVTLSHLHGTAGTPPTSGNFGLGTPGSAEKGTVTARVGT
eukprot:2501629-Rhodomonas_salina.1